MCCRLALAALLAFACATVPAAQGADGPQPVPKDIGKSKWDDKAPLGSPNFYPSAARPIGWRGDGSGHYPAATAPTEWYQKENGESKNILWKVKLPCYSWATPVIVGDKIITRSEPYDLICLDKNTGKILWVRSHPPFIAVTDEEKKANPAWKEVGTLVAELQKLNDEFVAKGWSKELYKQKYDLQHKIDDLTAKADKKYALPLDRYVESWAGYTAGTPCSDGQSLYIASGDGITARYDLDGNIKWLRYESLAAAWGEHGDACSPRLVGDVLLLANLLGTKALKKQTGETIWPADPKGPKISAKVEGPDYTVLGVNLIRISDGKIYTPVPPGGGGLIPTGGAIYGDIIITSGGRITWSTMETLANGDIKLTNRTPTDKAGYPALTVPADETESTRNYANFYVSSPIYFEGLLYQADIQGWFSVIDVKNSKVVYQKKLPLDFKNPPHRKTWGMGMGASIVLAGNKYLYVMDSAGCTVVLEPGREYKQVAKNNIEYTVPDGWEPKHWTGAHAEQTEATPILDGSRIYIRGEQFLYCIGEK